MNFVFIVIILGAMAFVNVAHPLLLKSSLSSFSPSFLALVSSGPWLAILGASAFREAQTVKFPMNFDFFKMALGLGLLGGVGTLTYFYAMKHMPAYLVVAVREGSPALTLVLAILIFKEKVSPVQWLFVSLIIIGVIGMTVTHLKESM